MDVRLSGAGRPAWEGDQPLGAVADLDQPEPRTGAAAVLGAEVGLAGKVTRGLAWSLVNSVVGRVGQLAVGILLAHLLAPRDFGVFAVAMVAYTIVISVSELGVSVALVRRPADGARLGPTVTTMSLLSSSVLVAGLWAAAPAIAAQLRVPAATGVLRVLSLAVLVAGVAAVPGALVQRDFQQKWRFAADSVNLVVSTAVVVVAALLGAGAYGLAWSRVAGNAASTVVYFLAANERYRPGFDRAVARELLVFGLPLAGASVLAFAVMNVDYVVVGRAWGPVVLGYYVLAFNLSGWPVAAFSTMARSVALPAFARLRAVPGAAGEAFVAAGRSLLIASVLVSVMLAVLARPVIHVVYGQRWSAAAVPLMFLATLGTVRVLMELAYDFLVALGRTRIVLLVQGVWFLALVVLLPVGARLGGLAGVGAGHLVAALCVVIPVQAAALHRAGVPMRAVARSWARPLVAGAVAAAVTAWSARWLSSDLATLALAGSLGTLAYLVVVGPALPAQVGWLAPGRWPSALRRLARSPAAGPVPVPVAAPLPVVAPALAAQPAGAEPSGSTTASERLPR